MATDLHELTDNLRAFHDLRGRVILSVGAGGGTSDGLLRPDSLVAAS